MRNSISENEIEEIALSYLQNLGYSYILGTTLSPDGEHPERQYTDVVLATRLRDAIDKLNPTITQDAKEDALKKVLRTESPNALINNETFHKYLTEGVDVEVRTADGIRGEKVYIVDFANAENNEFLAINQFTIIEGSQNKRPDLILFINGLPLVVIELKNAVDENATIKSAYNQLQTYKQTIPSLFTYNELLIVSDGWDALCGTVTSDFGRFMSWKTKDGETTADHLQPQMEVMFYGMLNKKTLLDLIRQFVVFEKSDTKTLKKVAAYHQYYAVNKAVESTVIASSSNGDRRGGVIWHTQGSGKSLSMVFYSGKLIIEPRMENPTLVILTDRNDLDEQLHETFTNCQQLLRQEPQKAEDRKDLRKLLKVASGGIVFTTIQKFMPMQTDIAQTENPYIVNEPSVEYIGADIPALSERKNIVVVADEAHRSQYDFIDGFAKHLRDALPNATFIGFTGTPIESTDRNTQAVFGNYVDIYDIQQAVNDKATVPIFYESRLAKVHFAEEEKVTLPEVLKILEESKENITINKKLTETSNQLQKITSELQKANETLVRKDAQKDEFLDTVTHELRTPITAIRAASEILHDDDEIPEELRKQFLQNIISESDRLNRLIDKILDLEKFETGKQTIHPSENNLIATIEHSIEPLKQLIKNRKVSVYVESKDTVLAYYDEDRIVQVVTNLLSNAIKFCPETDGLITIQVKKKDNFIETSIQDNGKGINPNDFDVIFDKFYQASNQNFKKPVGSGLGLAICKQIIEHHKGRIWVEPSVKGACIVFTLPVKNIEN